MPPLSSISLRRRYTTVASDGTPQCQNDICTSLQYPRPVPVLCALSTVPHHPLSCRPLTFITLSNPFMHTLVYLETLLHACQIAMLCCTGFFFPQPNRRERGYFEVAVSADGTIMTLASSTRLIDHRFVPGVNCVAFSDHEASLSIVNCCIKQLPCRKKST